jgi:hypothetical protein
LTTNRFGVNSNAYYFSGSTWIVVPNKTNLFFETQTISFWINTSSFNNQYSVLRETPTVGLDSDGYHIGTFNSYTQFGLQEFVGAGFSAQVGLSVSGYPVNTWFQMVIVRTPNTASIYTNGILALEETGLSPYNVVTNGTLHIGSNTGGTNAYATPMSFYTGYIDDIRIYNVGLSSNDVAQLYAIESAPIVNIQKAVCLTANNLLNGSTYQVQASSDLVNWTNQGSVFTATTNFWQSTNYWNVSDWNQLFFRLQVVP